MVCQLSKVLCYHLKSVNAISHYTDWTVAHVHIGALGWNGFLSVWYVILFNTKNVGYYLVQC
jgi:cytochrome c oxidase cbb3-type subunit I/II